MQVPISIEGSLTAEYSTKSQRSRQQHIQPPNANPRERMVPRSSSLLLIVCSLFFALSTAQDFRSGAATLVLSEDDVIAKEILWAKNRVRLHQQGFKINPTFNFDLENDAVFAMPAHEPYTPQQPQQQHFVAKFLRGGGNSSP